MGGASGVGGLLWVNQHVGSSAGTRFCAYDGNGNIVVLSGASDGSETTRYEYGPFGERIPIPGPMSEETKCFPLSHEAHMYIRPTWCDTDTGLIIPTRGGG